MPASRNRGFSLLEVIIALSVLMFVSLGLLRMLSSSSKSARSTERLVDLKFLARTFSENVDCQQTLGTVPIGDPSFTPLRCGDRAFKMGNVRLRRKDGKAFPKNMGGFDIQAGCENGVLAVEARKREPMLNETRWVDVFGGTSEMCRHFFTAGSVCPAGQRLVGQAGPVPVCGVGPDGPQCFIGAGSGPSGGGLGIAPSSPLGPAPQCGPPNCSGAGDGMSCSPGCCPSGYAYSGAVRNANGEILCCRN